MHTGNLGTPSSLPNSDFCSLKFKLSPHLSLHLWWSFLMGLCLHPQHLHRHPKPGGVGSGPGYVPDCLKGLTPYQQGRQPWSPLPHSSRALLPSMLMLNHPASLSSPLAVLQGTPLSASQKPCGHPGNTRGTSWGNCWLPAGQPCRPTNTLRAGTGMQQAVSGTRQIIGYF